MREMVRLSVFLFLVPALFSWTGCTTPPPKSVLTISEQIEVDTKKAQSLFHDFQKKVRFIEFPKGAPFLNGIAQKIARIRPGFVYADVKVLIHDDHQKNLVRFFSFPGTTISMPLSFLKNVEFENELAAAFSYELANVMNRHLAQKLEDETKEFNKEGKAKKESLVFELFGAESVFRLDREARTASIRTGSKLLYYSGYDLRGMASIFRQYASYFPMEFPESKNIDGAELLKNEVEFNLRESQRAKSELLPSLNPIVRSAEFIAMKKAAKHL